MNRFVLLMIALALVAAGCSGSREEISQEFFPGTDTTTSSLTPNTTGPTTTTQPPVDVEEMIGALADSVRSIRQVDFATPSIEYRPGSEITSSYVDLHGLSRTSDAQFDAAYLRMLGVLADGAQIDDLNNLCSLPGFYDPATDSLALVEGVGELTPLDRRHLVHELVAASTNQNHQWWAAMQSARAAGDPEGPVGAWGLVQGDAAFHAEQYVTEVLTPIDQFAITLEQATCDRERVRPPGYVRELEAYGPDVGRAYVEELLSVGGVGLLNDAYGNLPGSSEEIYHPTRAAADRPELTVDLGALSVPDFTTADAGVFGERTFRALLSENVTVAQALQASTGWGNDGYVALWNGSDVVLVATFEGDRVADAQELAETLGGWASESLNVGAGRPDNTGLAFEGEEYAFVAHRAGTMLMVLSNDSAAGRKVRDRFWPSW